MISSICLSFALIGVVASMAAYFQVKKPTGGINYSLLAIIFMWFVAAGVTHYFGW